MDKAEIRSKTVELQKVLLKYREQLTQYEKELFEVISRYQKAVDDEKIKELRESL